MPKDRLEVGDYLPMFQAFDQSAILNIPWNQIKGKPIFVLFFANHSLPACQKVLRALNQAYDRLEGLCHVFTLCPESVPKNAQVCGMLGLKFPVLSDEDRGIADLYGVDYRTISGLGTADGAVCIGFMADPNRQIVHIDRGAEGQDLAETALRLAEGLNREDTIISVRHAPVLYLPRVLDADCCRELVQAYETQGNKPSGIGRDEIPGKSARYFNEAKKVRRDHHIKDPGLQQKLAGAIERRLIPEVEKAFDFRITGVEEFKVGCYDAADGGHFFPHRDNGNPAFDHRRFAMTLNLNTGEYEGGYLRFPEYGPSLYRPDTGDAVVFSCALLHQAMPVTKGRRFVLLGFFFDAEAQRLRQKRRAGKR